MWNVLGASVTGSSHSSSGLPCQDYCRHLAFVANGQHYLALAISDGAGSASHSHIGSKISVESALAAIESIVLGGTDVDEKIALEILEEATAKVIGEAEKLSLSPRELACTLLFAIITAESSVFAQVGDGGWVGCKGTVFTPITWPLRGEYANETTFITSVNVHANFQFEKVDYPLDSVAGFTDGLQPVALHYASRSVHKPFFEPLFDILKSESETERLYSPFIEFLSTESLDERTDDDKTLLLASRRKLHLLQWPTSTKAEK